MSQTHWHLAVFLQEHIGGYTWGSPGVFSILWSCESVTPSSGWQSKEKELPAVGLVQRDNNIKDIKCVMIYFRTESSFQNAACVFFLLVLQAWFWNCTFGKKKWYFITTNIPLGNALLILDYFQTFLLSKGHIPPRSKGIITCYEPAGSFISLNFDMK